MYKNGQIITTDEYVDFVNWANANGGKFISEPVGDGTYKIVELPEPPEPPEPTPAEQNAVIAETRKQLYLELVDPLHNEKTRKVVLGEWTDDMEIEYVAEVKRLTIMIQTDHPYVGV